jgi:hypothetical protein
MIRTQLGDATREQLQALPRKPLSPKVRDRIEMVLLSDAGWSYALSGTIPRAAACLANPTVEEFASRFQPTRAGYIDALAELD